VEDKHPVSLRSHERARRCPRLRVHLDSRAEGSHPRLLASWDIGRDERMNRGAAGASGVGETLPKVPRRRAHPRAIQIEFVREQARAATLETPDRCLCLVLDDDLAPEPGG